VEQTSLRKAIRNMMSTFNPYQQWLGIADAVGTPNHYRLLGLRLFEDQPAIISAAAARLAGIVSSQLTGQYAAEAQRLLAEFDVARNCLLNPTAKTQYDAALRQQWSSGPLSPLAPIPEAEVIDPLLPPTAASWRTSTAVGAVPLAASRIPPSSPLPPLPAGAVPAGAAVSPNAPAVSSFAAQAATPVPPSSYAPGGPRAPLYGSPTPTAYPAAVPMSYAAPSPTLLASPAVPMATPAQVATPVYAAPTYAPPAAVPVAQPVQDHRSMATPATSYEAGPAVIAPRSRLSWRRRQPPTAGVLLGAATAVLVVVAVIVVAANRPDRVQPQPDRSTQVAAAARGEDHPAFGIVERPAPPRPQREAVKRPAPAEPDVNKVAMSNTPAAANPSSMPAPPPVPAPTSPAPAPAMTDSQKHEAVTKALSLARIALSQADPRTARSHVETARKAGAANRSDEIDRVESLARYTEDFNKAVREQIKGLEIGGQFPVKDDFVGVVEVQPESIVLRIQGQNRTFEIASLPPAIAYALAEIYLRKEDAATKIILGTYQAMHPRGDRAKARELWQAAAAGGAQAVADELLPELDVPLPGAAGMAAVADDSKPGADGRLSLPGAAAQSQARAEVQQMFEAEYAEAKDVAKKGPLAAKLLERAEKQSDSPAVRYILLLEAGKLAAEAGDFGGMATALDKLGELYAADAVELKTDALFEASKMSEGKEANQSLATAALALCDEAVLLDKIEFALKIARTAKTAASKSGDPDLAKQCAAREREVRELK
jgi:hypothetical protein